MAQRRMFSLSVIDTDLFLEMPQSTRLLYYELSMRAKDKGIVSNMFSICRGIGCEYSDIDILLKNKYIKEIKEKEYEIIHWEENNGISENSKKRVSYKYRKWRNKVIERDKNKCCICNSNEKLNVHHKKYWSIYPELRYEIDNGIILCEKCHKELHKKVKEGV